MLCVCGCCMLYENTLRFFVFVVLFGSLLAANRVWSTVHLCGSQRGFSDVPWKLLAWAMGGTTTNRWFLYYMHIGYCSAVGILHTKCLLLCVNAKPNAVTILAINDCYDCNEEINVYLLLRKFGQPYFAVCSNCACLAIHPRSEHYFDEWTCKVKYSSTKRSSSQMFEQTTMKTAYDQRSYAKVKPMALLTHFCVPLKLQLTKPNVKAYAEDQNNKIEYHNFYASEMSKSICSTLFVQPFGSRLCIQ